MMHWDSLIREVAEFVGEAVDEDVVDKLVRKDQIDRRVAPNH